MIATPEDLHHNEPKQQDRSQVKSALQSALTVRVVCIIEAYLQQWAGFVGLGREVDEPDPIVAEVANRWKALAAALVDRGMLLPGKEEKSGKVRFTQSIRGPDGKKARVYCFSDQVIGEPEDPTTARSDEEASYGK